MKTSLLNRKTRLFPCCVCREPREVRATKKGKPYMICDPCGMQMFVRVETGIRRFEAMVEAADRDDVWGRMAKLQRRYELRCPKCEKKFWLTPELIKTSWMSGTFQGYRCPNADCGGIAKEEDEDKEAA